MSEGTNKLTKIRVSVCDYGTGGYPEYMSIQRTAIKQVPPIIEDSEEFRRHRERTLCTTVYEELTIYEHETVRQGSMARRSGQRAAELQEVGARLFIAEELYRERPEIVRFVLEKD